MIWAGMMLIGSGVYLVDCAVVNRPPIGFIKQVIANPKDLVGQLKSSRGTWTDAPAFPGAVGDAATNAGAAIVGEPGQTTGDYHPDFTNGKMPDSALVSIPWAIGYKVYGPALPSLAAMNAAYKAKFGHNLAINSAYRTLAQQAIAVRERGSLAGKPGTSFHGWGVAVDFGGIGSKASAQYAWLSANAGTYGWYMPAYNAKTGEYWHWQWNGKA